MGGPSDVPQAVIAGIHRIDGPGRDPQDVLAHVEPQLDRMRTAGWE